MAPALVRVRGGWGCSCDVGSFRRTPGPYAVYDGARLPFRDGAFDTTLILLALHHCDDPDGVLDEALRVTRHRLIVMESVFRNRLDRFWLERLDGRLNARRHGGGMNVPLAFRTPDGWRRVCSRRAGLRVIETRWLGSWWERLVHHPALFVLEMPGPQAREIACPPPSQASRALVYPVRLTSLLARVARNSPLPTGTRLVTNSWSALTSATKGAICST